MSELEAGAADLRISGRPSLGALMQEAFHAQAWGRERRRDLRPLTRLAPFVARHLWDLFFGVLFITISTTSMLALTFGLRQVIDRFELHSFKMLERAFLFMAAGAVLFAATTGLRIYFVQKLGERVVADLRKHVFRHVLALDLAHFLRLRTGEVLSRMTTDMTIVERTVGAVAPAALRNLLVLTGALTMIVIFSPNFTLLVLMMLPVLLTPLFLLGKRVQRLSVRAQDRFAEAMGCAGEGLEAVETVQAFGREDAIARRFDRFIESAFDASLAQLRARGLMSAVMITLVFAGLLILLFECALAVFVQRTATGAPRMTGGTLLQLLFLALFAANAVRELSEVWGEIQKASGAAARVAQMMDTTPTICSPKRPRPLPKPPRGEVAFENVRFSYPGRTGPPALAGFSLRVRPGERVALVGPSGAGKSTVLRLLLRFYDPDSGIVRVDGVDLKAADPRQVRERMALVAQDTPLFSGSAAENIAFGREGATPEQIRDAALAAQAEGFLSLLPLGFDTPVGERAKTLSGGQRQRLAIARALLRASPILLLDEATSALDAENERLVQQALHEAMAGRTTLVIAHRLATVLEADRIVVMDAGRVVEEGRHTELLARGGLYARLAELQFTAKAA
ncbi:MAG TPA: ABC transporter transmembrane domain-containing protein [Caulobacteraceae bacterium]|nr:ABC transporter transmembrane domain-containing protein [Caulobacteraceae bacterium]